MFLIRIKKAIGRSYRLSALYHKFRLHNENRKAGEPIIIYQMGKVGSTAVLASLASRNLRGPIFHVHFLSHNGIEKAKKNLKKFMGVHHNANSWCLLESDFVCKNVLNLNDEIRYKIITLVREPISRNLSSFFYNIEKYIPDYYKSGVVSREKLTNIYLNRFIEHDMPLNWFDDELKKVLVFDIYNYAFPARTGYDIYHVKKADILLIKLEKLNECSGEAFKKYLGMTDFSLMTANTSKEQKYHEDYQKFIKEVRLPKQYIDMMYDSKYMRHFYEKDEIEHLQKKWLRS